MIWEFFLAHIDSIGICPFGDPSCFSDHRRGFGHHELLASHGEGYDWGRHHSKVIVVIIIHSNTIINIIIVMNIIVNIVIDIIMVIIFNPCLNSIHRVGTAGMQMLG